MHMCRAVPCRVCGKTTWAGCGDHVDEVLAAVPVAERCPGHEENSPERKGLFARVLGRH
jgi:hypothetical protein